MDYFLSLSIISLLIITGEAIRCYECSYCTDLSKSEKIVRDCPDTPKGAACFIVSYVLSNYTSGIRSRGCSSKSLVTDERSAPKSVDMGNGTAKVYIQLLRSMFRENYSRFYSHYREHLITKNTRDIILYLSS
ncbi:uncharacterized protein LOC123272078 isoform X2 [Cotesia glomerata]|uniref:uncharacterized protein LOC123272078 isoform X2 n=1 Tax=Cotesia glomerata TaxID=32391 RepID=UPI001D01CA38|nr:uncharacterized protein LOC123272078 isoform X2 [Cotesia glomerata]